MYHDLCRYSALGRGTLQEAEIWEMFVNDIILVETPVISRVFGLFDADRTGYVSFKNLKDKSIEYQLNLRDDDLKYMMDIADIDGDGVLNEDEFKLAANPNKPVSVKV